MGAGDDRLRLYALGDGFESEGRGGRAWGDHQRAGLRRPVLSLLRQQAPQATQPARPTRDVSSATSPSTGSSACASSASIRLASRARSTRTTPNGVGSHTDTTVIPQVDLKKYPHGGMLCLLGPYGDFFIDVLAEILTMYPAVDAFSFDGLHYGGVCYCRHCRDNYRKDTGAAIPRADMNDPAFRRYQHWADRRMEDLVRRMQERLKRIKPEVALVTWTHQRRPVRPLPVDPAQHARADEPIARRARPGVLARRDQSRHHDRAGVRQCRHLGDDQPPHRVQRAVHPQPRQPLRQGQLPPAGDPPPDAADPHLRRRAEHRRGPAGQPPAGALRLPRRGQAAQGRGCRTRRPSRGRPWS